MLVLLIKCIIKLFLFIYLLFRIQETAERNPPASILQTIPILEGKETVSYGFLSCDDLTDLLQNSGLSFSRPEIEHLASGKDLSFTDFELFQ
jgi:hypothetical protein